jgi:pyruvate kinase
MLLRRTKILATLGPATDKPGVLEDLFKAGIDVVRLNFSHGSAQDHIDRANRVRELSKKPVVAWVFWLICKGRKSASNV